MTSTLQRRDGALVGARCDHCKASLDARTERQVAILQRGHRCPVRRAATSRSKEEG